MKTCSKCKVEKPPSEFYLRTDGRPHTECKGCAAVRAKRWHEENPEKVVEAKRKWTLNNPEKMRLARKQWRVENRDRENALSLKWKKNNRNYGKVYISAWTKKNAASVNARNALRYAKKLRAVPVWANLFFISEIYDLAKLRTKHLGNKYSVDHIVPLKSKLVCGLHVENNLRVIPHVENISKSNRYWPEMPDLPA